MQTSSKFFILLLIAIVAVIAWFALFEDVSQIEEDPPVAINEAPQTTETEPLQEVTATDGLPAFDVARVDRDGNLLVAGRALPNSRVEIYTDGKKIATVEANGQGEWVYLSDLPLPAGDTRIDIRQIKDGKVATGERSLFLTVRQARDGDYLAVIADRKGGHSRLLHSPGIGTEEGLMLEIIDYDSKGRVFFQGRALKDNFVNLYLDNKLVGRQKADKDGRWILQAKERIAPGNYNLRLDMVLADGKVRQRLEFPFQRSDVKPGDFADGKNYRVVVQPGNSLWRLARRTLGEGVLYTVIYTQNKDQIRDPDLIYPGQVFKFSQ